MWATIEIAKLTGSKGTRIVNGLLAETHLSSLSGRANLSGILKRVKM